MVSWVMRNLRRQKVKNEKGKKTAEEQACTVTIRELHDMFPGLTEGIIRSRLKDRCSCIAYKAYNPCTPLFPIEPAIVRAFFTSI